MKEEKEVSLMDAEEDGHGWPPANIKEFAEWLVEQVDQIPSEYRDSGEISISGVCGYDGDSSGNIEITYRRPETDEEEKLRETASERRASSQRDYDLRKLAILKAKYETGEPT